ncbi:D-alanyl-D-alanine carboxypeptidase [Pseudomonadales bacterium]|nr:D-alanyl-D-alanine carboxypeptidase [Pseudomonadales bacterium]
MSRGQKVVIKVIHHWAKLLVLAFIVSGTFAQAQSSATLIPSSPQLAASSYLLIDVNSGKIIIESNADEQLPPASLTKMMTSYIVSSEIIKGNISSDDAVPISVKAWRMGGSKMFIREGTTVPVSELLKGVIIQSGNDASVALAEFVAGDEAAFAEVMNQQASLLGMQQTHFINATGWPAKGHLTTARDLSILAKSLIQHFPDHYALYSEKEFTYNKITQPNRNGLLWRDTSVDGLKTGWTEEAGYCLVASAKRDDMRLVSVVMGAKSGRGREQETQKLLSYGFRYYETHQLYSAEQVINSPRLWAGASDTLDLVLAESVVLTVPRGQRDNLQATIEVDKNITAPISAGQSYGVLNISLNGEVLEQRELLAANNIETAPLFSRLWDHLILFIRGVFGLD